MKLNINKIYFLPKNAPNHNDVMYLYNPKRIGCVLDRDSDVSDWTFHDCINPDIELLSLSVIDKENNYRYQRPEDLIEIDMNGEEYIKKVKLAEKLRQ